MLWLKSAALEERESLSLVLPLAILFTAQYTLLSAEKQSCGSGSSNLFHEMHATGSKADHYRNRPTEGHDAVRSLAGCGFRNHAAEVPARLAGQMHENGQHC